MAHNCFIYKSRSFQYSTRYSPIIVSLLLNLTLYFPKAEKVKFYGEKPRSFLLAHFLGLFLYALANHKSASGQGSLAVNVSPLNHLDRYI